MRYTLPKLMALATCYSSFSLGDEYIYETLYEMSYNHAFEIITPGVAKRWEDNRRNIFLGEGFCSDKKTHAFFDFNGEYLGSIENSSDPIENQNRINNKRKELSDRLSIPMYEGSLSEWGYPIAISCDFDTDKKIYYGLKIHYGEVEEGLMTGTIRDDNITYFSVQRKPLEFVFNGMLKKGDYNLSDYTLSLVKGQCFIESSGNRETRSNSAYGICQISKEVFHNECEKKSVDIYHRMEQVSCQLSTLERLERNFKNKVKNLFSHLDEEEQEVLTSIFALQAYHTGYGNIRSLLFNSKLPEDIEKYSPEDLHLTLILSSYGANSVGVNSITYVTDTKIASKLIREYVSDKEGEE